MAERPMPRIQASTGTFWAFELRDAMDALAGAGFSEIELMITRDPSTQDPETPLRLAQERGLSIGAVHGPFLVVTRSVWGSDPIQKIIRGVEFCRAVGADTYIVHPPYLWEGVFADWIERQAAAYAAREGVTISVETMYPKWVAGRRVGAHRWLNPKALSRAAPTVTMDTSHLAVARRDILDVYRILEPKLVHIHLSDNAGDGRDGHLALHQGKLPIDRFLAELGRTKYGGTVSLELSVRAFIDRPQDLIDMLAKNREHVVHGLTRARMEKGLPGR